MNEFKFYFFNGRDRIWIGSELSFKLAREAAANLAEELSEHGYNAWHTMLNDGTGSYVVNCLDGDDKWWPPRRRERSRPHASEAPSA